LCSLLGYSEPELQTLRIPDFTHPEDMDVDLAQTQQMLADEIPFFTMDRHAGRRSRGSSRPSPGFRSSATATSGKRPTP
jgi:PAS domain S-box-containing protein